jgi:hypothetical protein
MVAVRGIYQGGDTVKLDAMPVPVHGPYEKELTEYRNLTTKGLRP